MFRETKPLRSWMLLCSLALLAPTAHAEVVEEVIAWVNGDIITRSDFETEEEGAMQDAYRNLTGEDLDREVEAIRKNLLLELIDRKILLHRAPRFADMGKLADYFYKQFLEMQDVKDEEELEAQLVREGLTVEGLKERLVEMFAPDRVKEWEVGDRVAVGDRAIEAYYEAHPDEFVKAGEVTIREIVLLIDSESGRGERRDTANELHARALSEDFAALAEEFSEAGTRTKGGLLGPLKKGDLSTQLEGIAFGLPVGNVSDVLDMPYGFHILKVESRIDDKLMPLDEVRESLRDHLTKTKRDAELQVFMTKARAEAEWCVKPAFRLHLSVESPPCKPY